MFLTRKRANREIQEAVAQVGPHLAVLQHSVEALQGEVARLRADQAERETEIARDLDARLKAERALQDAGVQGLMQAVQEIADRPQLVPVDVPDLSPRIEDLSRQVWALTRDAGEVQDMVTYLFEAPTSTVTVYQNIPGTYGVRAVADQHVRPMGVR
jgi:chromosome segregation ATPase